MSNFQDTANFIWQVADDILRGSFKQHEYGDVILPFVVLRRLDCVLEDKKDAVMGWARRRRSGRVNLFL
jgi:type I restriction enzyme M protein